MLAQTNVNIGWLLEVPGVMSGVPFLLLTLLWASIDKSVGAHGWA